MTDVVGTVLESTARDGFLELKRPNNAAVKPGVLAGWFVLPGGVVDMLQSNGVACKEV